MLEAVTHARSFAIAAHGDQMYGDHPYSVHLDTVAELLAPFGEEAQIVGYLHDKAADRLANLRMSARDESGSNLETYRREHSAFRHAAYRRGLCDELWQEIDIIIDGCS